MNRRTLQLALIVMLSVCLDSVAFTHHQSFPLPPDPDPQPSDLTAAQVIAKSVAARGGEQKLKGIRSVTMTGTWESNRIKPSPVTLMIAPGRYLRKIEDAGGVMIKAVDGQATWEVAPQAGIHKLKPMATHEAARYRRLADPQGPLVDAQAKGNKAEMVGRMPWRSTTVYKVKLTFRDGGVNHVYFDAQSFLPVRVVNTMFIPQLNREVPIEFIYEDFRDVNGVKWPFKEKASSPEVNFTQNITWKKIEINKPLDEAAFKALKS